MAVLQSPRARRARVAPGPGARSRAVSSSGWGASQGRVLHQGGATHSSLDLPPVPLQAGSEASGLIPSNRFPRSRCFNKHSVS